MRQNAADILCIGAQRAMTSWLHQALSAHPGTWAFPDFHPATSSSKEAHYWDWNHKRGADWYRVLTRPLNDVLQSMDFTPEYAFLTRPQIAECKALNPAAKVVYILRDPLARAISGIRMHTMWASNNAKPDELTLRMDKPFRERCKNARIWDHGDYARNLRRWREHYPDLLVLNYEDLRTDPQAGFRRVLEHCGLDWDSLDEPARATLTQRAARHVWATPAYPLDANCLDFLHGAMWPLREALTQETGITFTEGDRLLEAQP